MSFKCSKCSKLLSSLQRLATHMAKAIPCDFKCKQCDFHGENVKSYLSHALTHKIDKVEDEPSKEVVLDIEPLRRPPPRVRLPGMPQATPAGRPLIPIQDFDPQCLKELAALANKEDVEIVLERIRMTIRPLKQRRAEEAVKSFQKSDYAHSLRCLDQGINTAAANILSKFHGDPERPEQHTIKMGDISRKMINIYSRPSEEDQSQWLSFAKEPALTTLSEHASAVLTYALELAANMLRYKFCVKEKTVCFCLHDEVLNKNLIIVDEEEFEGTSTPTVNAALGIQPTLKVMFYDDVLTDIVQGYGYTAKAIKLGELINQKTEEVLEQLKTLVLTEADVISFLERTRRPITAQLIKN